MSEETTFFQSKDIAVTNARFIVGAQTFAMSGITSVRGVETPASYAAPIILIFMGLLMFLSLLAGLIVLSVLGVLILASGMWLAFRRTPKFSVVLVTAGGEITAYQSQNREYISQIIRALNDSIIARG